MLMLLETGYVVIDVSTQLCTNRQSYTVNWIQGDGYQSRFIVVSE